MTLKQFITNLTIQNIKYFIQGKYKSFIQKQYNKHFTQDSIDEMLYKVSQCPTCYLNNSAECCGCNFIDMIKTNKHCKNGNF